MRATYVLSLDLGAANLRAHRAAYSGERVDVPPQAAPLSYALDDALPTILELEADGQEVRAYGKPALDRLFACEDESRFVFDFKPSLGQAPEDLSAPTRPGSMQFRYSRDEAFAWTERLLAPVVEDLEERVYGEALTSENAWAIVAGVPLSWREDTRQRLQGILARRFHNEQVSIVSETEAALAYHLSAGTLPKSLSNRQVLVIHLGALLTQVTRVRATVTQGKLQVQSARTYTERYGGADFDMAFSAYIAQRLGISGEPGIPPGLRQHGRKLKEEYSMSAEIGFWQLDSAVELPDRVGTMPVSIDRATFESEALGGYLTRKFARLVRRALEVLKQDRARVGAVIVTGASAAWYFVRATLEQLFPEVPVLIGTEPQRVISIGLALSPAYLLPASRPARRGDPYGLLLQNRTLEAEKLARERLEWELGDALARAVVGYALLRQGKSAEGQREIQAVIAENSAPIEPEAKQALSLAYAGSGWLLRDAQRYVEAERDYLRSIDLDERNLLAHTGLGFLYQCQQKVAQAYACYQRALSIDPNASTPLRYLGKLYLDQQKFAAAEQIFRKLLPLGVRDVFVSYSLGLACAGVGKQVEAEKWYQEALALNPEYAPAHTALGALYRGCGRTAEAERSLTRALALDADNPLTHHYLALLYEGQGQVEKALAAYQRTLALDPKDATACHNMAGLLARRQRYQEAEQAYQRALALQPQMLQACYNLARLYHRQERYDEAVRQYEAVLRIDPHFQPAIDHRSTARQRQPSK